MPKPMTNWSSYLGATENWLLDSGATDHLTPFGSDFTEYTAYSHWGQGGLETGDYMLGTFRAHVHLSHNVTGG